MKRLAKENLNTAERYNEIFTERQQKGVNWMDERRWRRLLSEYVSGSICDLGCLDSGIYEIWYRYGHRGRNEYWGVDQAKKAIEEMKIKYPGGNWKVDDVYELICFSEVYDYVIMGELLEHLEEPERALKEAMRVLKPGGTLALSVPYNETEAGEIDGQLHLWSFSADDIIGMLRPYGEVKLEILGSQPKPEYRYHFPYLVAFCRKRC